MHGFDCSFSSPKYGMTLKLYKAGQIAESSNDILCTADQKKCLNDMFTE